MARNHTANPSLAQSRNRVTNKTRLKVYTEGSNGNPILFRQNEDNVGMVSVAGVDREDANEHHLQVALSATTSFNSMSQTSEEGISSPCIPTPDSAGAVDNYEELYPRDRPWQHPTTYLKFSDTVEESVSFPLFNGFIYYMDDRDKEWLEKHNTDAQSQWLQRASTDQDKESQASSPSSPIVISDDEYELVMAIFEKITVETPEHICHGLEWGKFPSCTGLFPSMSDIPEWVCRLPDDHLLRVAQAIYPHWVERRLDRRGCPIMPSVNLDEDDVGNEAYVCFRRRPSKAVRRIRIPQVTYRDKLQTLQTELGYSLRLAEEVRQREIYKRNVAAEENRVLIARLNVINAKRTNMSLAHENDDELLFNIDPELPNTLEKPPNGPEPARREDMSHRHPTPQIQDRKEADTSNAGTLRLRIPPRKQVHDALSNKRKNEYWEDATEDAYQPSPIPYPTQFFKAIGSMPDASTSTASTGHPDEEPVRSPYAARLRYGRGGRLYLDRRMLLPEPRRAEFNGEAGDVEEEERIRGLHERWRFDRDDEFVDPDERDRVLVNDLDPRYLAQRMRHLSLQNLQSLRPDQSITVTLPNGRREKQIPYTLPSQFENGSSHSPEISSSSVSPEWDILGQGQSNDNMYPPILYAAPIPQDAPHAQFEPWPRSNPGTFPSHPFTFRYPAIPPREAVSTAGSPHTQNSSWTTLRSIEYPRPSTTVPAMGRLRQPPPALYRPAYQWAPSQPSEQFCEPASAPGPSTVLQPATFSPTSSPESDPSSTKSPRSLVMPSSPTRQSRGTAGGPGAGHH